MNKSPWHVSGRFVGIIVTAFGLAFLGLFLLNRLSLTEKVRGSELALSLCRWELNSWKQSQTNSNFAFSDIPTEDKQRAAAILGHRLDGWVKTNFTWVTNVSNREIVIICGKEFDNVPRPSLWNFYRQNPAHAVAFSDGTVGLISPPEFASMDRKAFIRLYVEP